jgi:hypothetical protein
MMCEITETLKDCLRQVAVHGETEAACDAAEAALEQLSAPHVIDVLLFAGRYRDALQVAYVDAVRKGIFDVE